MVKTIEAFYDGRVLLPEEPLELEPNTRVQITIRDKNQKPRKPRKKKKAVSFLDVARSLSLDVDLPSDFSANLHHYLNKGIVSNEE